MSGTLSPVEVIERGRRGEAVDEASVRDFVEGWLNDAVTDGQMAAWCMAVCLRGLDRDGTSALTEALIASGDRLDLAKFGPTGDKHSTGGVGDASTLIVAPLAAAMGAKVAKMSARGLSHTGGTLDKLEAIPGMEVELDLTRFVRQLRDVGVVVAAGSDRLVPAERRLYRLRDLTATAESPALIASSIISKKIAGGAAAIVLDVKAGSGAFFADRNAAREAAELMIALATPWGRSVRYLVSAMDQPLGRMVGNALEVRGAAEVLRGDGAPDLRELAVRLAGALAEAAGAAREGEGVAAAVTALDAGEALRTAERWIEAQGGDAAVLTDDSCLPDAPMQLAVEATQDGVVHALDARRVGEAARWLGAGRLAQEQFIDHAVGVELHAKIGDSITRGEPVATIHARDGEVGLRAVEMMLKAVRIGAEAVPSPPLVLDEG